MKVLSHMLTISLKTLLLSFDLATEAFIAKVEVRDVTEDSAVPDFLPKLLHVRVACALQSISHFVVD